MNSISKYLNGVVTLAIAFMSVRSGAQDRSRAYPETVKRVVTDSYQGVSVDDPYRWLEDSNNSEVKKWTELQNNYARAYLDKIASLEPIRSQLKKWNDFQSASYLSLSFKNGIYFALKLQPPKNQPLLVSLTSLQDLSTERVIVDPNKIDGSGTTAIDFYAPSRDGKYVAVSLSKGGSEEGTLNVYETQEGKHLPDQIPLVNKPTAGGSVAWAGDGEGFYYTRYPYPGERTKDDLDFYQQVYFHKLGDNPKSDAYTLGKEFPRIAEVQLVTSDDGQFTLAIVANGDGGEFAHYLRRPNGAWSQLTQFSDRVTIAAMGLHGELYLKSIKENPKGSILSLPMADGTLKGAKTLVKESDAVIEEIVPTDHRVFVVDGVGGPSTIRSFDLKGKSTGMVAAPALATNGNVIHTTGDGISFRSQSYVEPAAWFSYEPSKTGEADLKTMTLSETVTKAKSPKSLQPKSVPMKTALATESSVDFSDITVKREFATSKDGTRVPVNILFKKGTKLDGNNPAILYGYGGYGVSLSPRFNPDIHLWLQHGGIYAIANLRGGGEFGEGWHLGGNLVKKQNVFDDFIGCATYLIKSKYTKPEKLVIEGGSNGGLLMGAALTQRPELFRAVVSHVGIYDMLRVENDPNGAFNVTEFGSVKDAAQFRALYGYSPFHHVSDSVAYPAVLLLTGANDGRVNPYHSKKMTARLQAATRSDKPVLLRVTFDGGHGIGRSVAQKVSEEADVMAFLFDQLGIKE